MPVAHSEIVRHGRVLRQLRGQHCQCAGCGEYFNSQAGFDMHRTGAFGIDRRCLSPDEMRKAGMAISASGWWVTSLWERENGPAGAGEAG